MPTCLFVCADNALASRLAEALFNARPPRGWRATSAGLRPAAAADPRAGEVLAKLRYPAPTFEPREAATDLLSYMRVIVGVCLPDGEPLPERFASRLDHRIELPDPEGLPDSRMSDWMADLTTKMQAVIALCHERTPDFLG